MFKETEINEILKMIDEATNILKIEIIEESKNHTLSELKQKIINYLYSIDNYDAGDIEMIKILFESK